MKINRILPVAVCGALLFASCDDDKMDWHTPEGHTPISSIDEIPLSTDEAMANYKFIKEYMAEYMPGVTIGLGLGADKFLEDEQYQKVAANNFQQFVTGNAMKFGSVCKSNGNLDFTKIDNFIDKAKELNPDVKIFGHNLLWHTQQPQVYLKSLIAPEQEIQIEEGETIENIITNSDFESGSTSGWGAYSSGGCSISISDEGDGNSSKYSGKLNNPAEPGENYSAQAYYTLPVTDYKVGDVYVLAFDFKADHVDEKFQAQWQNRSSYSAKKYFNSGSAITKANTWLHYEEEFELTEEMVNLAATNPDKMHITFDFGAAKGYVWIDNVKFGKKIESGPVNYCSNGSFENGTDNWSLINKGQGIEVIESSDAISGGHLLKMTASSGDEISKENLQIQCDPIPAFQGKKVRISYWVKSDAAGSGSVYFSGDLSNKWPWINWTGNQSSWTGTFETSTEWTQINFVIQNFNFDFNDEATTWYFQLNFGGVADVTYYIDDVKVTVEEATSKRMLSKATTITYKLMPSEEKQTALLTAMETWITDMVSHCKEKGNVTEWDVLNEAIGDDSKIRGVDGGFMSDDGQPTESETDGLNLNWASDHFYWGYFLGKDYAVKAFQFARAAAGDDAKLYINDYNLETSDSKLEALINYVKYIDETNGSAIVDGIGTQMHIMSFNPDDTKNDAAKEGIKNMFTKLASTGKLVRISELDVAFSYTHDDETKVNPSAEQLQAQADTYKFVIEQYKAIIPTEQQGGICIWTLTDADDEHEYWLKGDKPNLFNADYTRKPAYKGVCDGIAGKDLSADFNGSDWSN